MHKTVVTPPLDALKRIPPFENNKRTIWPTSVFEYPEVQIKKDPFISNEIDEDKSLVSQFQGFSPLLSREIEYRLNNSSKNSYPGASIQFPSTAVGQLEGIFQ